MSDVEKKSSIRLETSVFSKEAAALCLKRLHRLGTYLAPPRTTRSRARRGTQPGRGPSRRKLDLKEVAISWRTQLFCCDLFVYINTHPSYIHRYANMYTYVYVKIDLMHTHSIQPVLYFTPKS